MQKSSTRTKRNTMIANANDQEHLATAFRLGIFKLNGLLLRESELDLGGTLITKSRARLLGVLMQANQPMTIPQICHEMGVARQGVGRLVNLMIDDGLLELRENPLHVKSKYVAVTRKGEKTYETIHDYHVNLSNQHPLPVSDKDLKTANKVINSIIAHLENTKDSY